MSSRNRWIVHTMMTMVLISSIASCTTPPDDREATSRFAGCLERNGIEAEDIEVTLESDGSVATISATIVSEGGVAYEPTIRLSCTEEVELSQ